MMRGVTLVVLLGLSTFGMGQTGPVEQPQQSPQPPVLQGANAQTVTVPAGLLRGLAITEPDIPAQNSNPQQGTVALKVLVSKKGAVKEAVAVRGEGDLTRVAVEGVKNWKYRPYAVEGKVRELQSTILLEFSNGVGRRAVMGARPGSAPQQGPVNLSSGASGGMLVHHVAPVYPAGAKALHVQGIVVLHATISKAGEVEELQVVSGPSQLVDAAEEAVRQWRYAPYLVNGDPTEVATTINVNFVFSN